MRRPHVLLSAAAGAIAAGVLTFALPALADDAPVPTPSVSVSVDPSYPDPPHKPIPSGPTTETPPTADPSVSPPPWPSFPPDDPDDF